MIKTVIMGAGGKMGCRITDNIKASADYDVRYVEIAQAGIDRLRERGVVPTAQNEALADAQIVILAVPDDAIGTVSAEVVPSVPSGTIVVCLDPAASVAGVLPEREDITYFICHPCHPPLFNDETDPRARDDWFGGTGVAKQDAVCALFRGPEANYAVGERLVRTIFAPIRNAHRITAEQMVILEPALVESISSTLVEAIKQALDEAVRMGVPKEAAEAFLMGHLRVQFGVLFGYAGFPFSDGAIYALEKARTVIFKPDWKAQIMNPESIRRSVNEITGVAPKG